MKRIFFKFHPLIPKTNDQDSLLGFMIFPKVENKKLFCKRFTLQKNNMGCNECGKCYSCEL